MPSTHGNSPIATIGDIFDTPKNVFKLWVDDISYSAMLKKVLLPVPGDPEILIISDDISSQGVVKFGNSFTVPEGTLTESVPGGDIAISTLDSDGNIIDSVNLSSGVKLIRSFDTGDAYTNPVTDAGGTPFVVKLPVTSRISSIQVSKQGKVLDKTTLKAQGLASIIQRIPDNAFKIAPCPLKKGKCIDEQKWRSQFVEEEREILNKQVSVIQRVLDSKHPKKADALLRVLLAEIRLVTYNNYQVPNAFYINQAEALSEIEDIIKGLDGDESECSRHNWKWWK